MPISIAPSYQREVRGAHSGGSCAPFGAYDVPVTDRAELPNPYAAPLTTDASRKPESTRAPGENVKWIYALAALIDVVASAILLATWVTPSVPYPIVSIAEGATKTMLWLTRGCGLVWIYYAWKGVPAVIRPDVTPAGAVGRCFIPLYNFYWMFAVNTRLCNHIDDVLGQAMHPLRAPKSLAIVAATLHLMPALLQVTPLKDYGFVALLGAEGLWLAYMFQCDRARRAFAEIVSHWPPGARPIVR
jgi:hypothetical protein